jgi:pantoate--beta-alanine ligase
MIVVNTAQEFNNWRHQQDNDVGFVPTLGALHEGHFSLVRQSKKRCDVTVVSIFLNPTQFAPSEDLDSYPNTLDADIKQLQTLEVDVLFLPTNDEMYSNVADVQVPPSDLFKKLEGQSRPHFFYGVTTIVAKLFNVIKPTHTFFGKKDAQQLRVIQQMIDVMDYQIELVACPIIRDRNGLAISSRNQYLSIKEQQIAAIIYHSLIDVKSGLNSNQNIDQLKRAFIAAIQSNADMSVDYISIARSKTLEEITQLDGQEVLISTAVFFKSVRLIDNITHRSSMH